MGREAHDTVATTGCSRGCIVWSVLLLIAGMVLVGYVGGLPGDDDDEAPSGLHWSSSSGILYKKKESKSAFCNGANSSLCQAEAVQAEAVQVEAVQARNVHAEAVQAENTSNAHPFDATKDTFVYLHIQKTGGSYFGYRLVNWHTDTATCRCANIHNNT